MWVYPLAGGEPGTEIWDGIVAGFNEQHPDAEVNVEIQPWAQRNEKLLVALAAGAGPDICYLNEDFIPQHAEEGNIVPLGDLLADDVDDYYPRLLEAATVDGQIFTAPILATVNTVLYNTTVFESAGVTTYPTSWDELLEVAPTFKEQGLYVTQYSASLEQSLNLSYYPLLWQAGGSVLNEDNSAPAFNSDAGLEALNFIISLFENEYVDTSMAVTIPEAGQAPLDQGKAALGMIVSSNDPIIVDNLWGEGAIKVGEPLMNKTKLNYGSMAGFSLFKDAADNAVAKAWIKYLVSPEVMPTILAMGNYMTPRQSLAGLYADKPILKEFENNLPNMRTGVRHSKARQIIAALAPYLQGAILGETDPEQALADGEQDIARLLSR
jgi:multiple sugar transport system substrate-binding protein